MMHKRTLHTITFIILTALFTLAAITTWGSDQAMSLSFAFLAATFAVHISGSSESPDSHTTSSATRSIATLVLTLIAATFLLISIIG